MTNNNPVVFDPQNQWAKELGASFIGSMAVIYFAIIGILHNSIT